MSLFTNQRLVVIHTDRECKPIVIEDSETRDTYLYTSVATEEEIKLSRMCDTHIYSSTCRYITTLACLILLISTE